MMIINRKLNMGFPVHIRHFLYYYDTVPQGAWPNGYHPHITSTPVADV